MKIKRIVSVALVLVLMATFFAGCGGKQVSEEAVHEKTSAGSTAPTQKSESKDAAKEITVTYWQLSDRSEYFDKIVEDFKAVEPNINVVMAYNSTDDQKKNLKVAASSGTLPTMWFNWGGSLGSFYPENGLAYDLTQYAKEHKWEEKFLPDALKLCEYNNGKLYGYPLTINMLGAFYIKEVFEECGLKPPASFSEFETCLETLKKKGYTPLCLGGKFGWHLMRLVEALIEMEAGADVHDKLIQLEGDWTDEGVVRGFAKYKEFIDKGYFLDGFISLDPTDMWNVLFSKKAIITIEGPWAPTSMTLYEQKVDDYGYFKLPLGEKGNRISSFVEMAQFNANLSDEELDAAVKFLDYCFDEDVIKNKYPTLTKYPTAIKDGYLPEEYSVVKEMINDMNEYGAYTITDQALPQEVIDKFFQVQDLIAGGTMTPEQAGEYMNEAVKAYKEMNK